jgi:uncharacterized protein (DUF58 family)
MPRRPWTFWMPPQDHVGLRWALLRYRGWLTPAGRTLLWGALAGAVLSSPGTSVAAYLVPCAALAALLSAWVLALPQRPTLQLRRELPPPVCAGERLRYRVTVHNPGRRPVRALSIQERDVPHGVYTPAEAEGGAAELEVLPAGASAHVTLALDCPHRGVYELGALQAGSAFPSMLVRWPRRREAAQRLIVYPGFVPQTQLELPAGRRYQPGGIAVSSGVGDSGEFAGTREWREGDRLRDIHWASSARSGRMIVKEWREEYFVRIGLVLDTEQPRRARAEALEARISLAAGIADALARRDYVIDLYAAGEELHHFQAGRALARLENLLELLSCVAESRRVDFVRLEAGILPHAARLSSVVVLLSDWDGARARMCRALQQAGIAVRAIVVRDGPPSTVPDAEVVVVPAGEAGGVLR